MHKKKRILIVDGYNVLNAWRTDLRGASIDDAREAFTALLQDYAGYSGQSVIVVYDAWLSDRKTRTVEDMGNLSVVFTQKGETADHYIERLTDKFGKDIDLDRVEVRVATSDGIEQTVVLGRGATRVSAREMLSEMEHVRSAGRARTQAAPTKQKSTVMERLPEDVRQKLEKIRRGTQSS